MRCSAARERGSVTPLVLVVLVISMVVVTGVERLGTAAALRARVDAGADLVALAAVTGDRAEVDRVAAAVGASVVTIMRSSDGVVEVTVERAGVRGRAAAAPAGWHR